MNEVGNKLFCFWLFGILVGFVAGIGLVLYIKAVADDLMCSGKPRIVKTPDTVRTFTCKVELKKGE